MSKRLGPLRLMALRPLRPQVNCLPNSLAASASQIDGNDRVRPPQRTFVGSFSQWAEDGLSAQGPIPANTFFCLTAGQAPGSAPVSPSIIAPPTDMI